VYDDEQPQKEVELQPMDDYLGGPHYLSLLIMYHVHVVKSMSNGVVRFYNFKVLCNIFNVNYMLCFCVHEMVFCHFTSIHCNSVGGCSYPEDTCARGP